MKEAKFEVQQGGITIAEGSIFHEDGKALDSKAANAVGTLAVTLGSLHSDALIWRPGKGDTKIGVKRIELRGKVKDGEPKYKAVAA